jgi:hypothetical protein
LFDGRRRQRLCSNGEFELLNAGNRGSERPSGEP